MLPILINNTNQIYTQYTKPIPFVNQKYSQLVEPGTTNLFGQYSDFSVDNNGDSIPDIVNGSITFTNQTDIYKSVYWVTKGTKPGFNIYIENKQTGTNNTSAEFVTNQINIQASKTYMLSLQSDIAQNGSLTVRYRILNSSGTEILQWTALTLNTAVQIEDGTIYYQSFTTPANAQKLELKFTFTVQSQKQSQILLQYVQLEENTTWTSYINGTRPISKIISDIGYHESLTVYGYFYVPPSKRTGDQVIISIGKPNDPNSITLQTENNRATLTLKVLDSTGQTKYTKNAITYDQNGWTFFQLGYRRIDANNIELKLFINSTKVVGQNVQCSFNYNSATFKSVYIGHGYTSGNISSLLNGFLSYLSFNASLLGDDTIQSIYTTQPIYSSQNLLITQLRFDQQTLNGFPASTFALQQHVHSKSEITDLQSATVQYANNADKLDNYDSTDFALRSGTTFTGTITFDGSNVNISSINNTDFTISSWGAITLDIDSDNNSTDFFRITQHNKATTLLYINDSGNIGIGTSSPSDKLHVSGNIKSNNILPTASNTYDLGSSSLFWRHLYLNGRIYLEGQSDGSNIEWSIHSNGETLEIREPDDGDKVWLSLVDGTGIKLQPDGTTVLDVQTSQIIAYKNLVPNATSTLDIGSSTLKWKDGWFSGQINVSSLSVSGDSTITGSTFLFSTSSKTEMYDGFGAQNNKLLELGIDTATSGSTPFSVIALTKNLTGTDAILGAIMFTNKQVTGTNKRLAQITVSSDGQTNSGRLEFQTQSAGTLNTRVVIKNDGKVGIGVTSPQYSLDVSGDIRQSGQIISTVATGTAPFSVSSSTVVTNLNADLLDGYDSSVSNTANTIALRDSNGSINAKTVILNLGNKSGNDLPSTWPTGLSYAAVYNNNYPVPYGTVLSIMRSTSDSGVQLLLEWKGADATPGSLFYRNKKDVGTDAWSAWSKVWSDTNDGHGSGLDADLLDGQEGSYYTNQSNLNAGTVPSARLSGTYNISISGNAQTQTKLANAVSISLGGDLSGSASFDGSSNITITADVKYNVITQTLASQLQQNTNYAVAGANFETGEVEIIRDGIYQIEGIDYTIVNSTTVKFTYNIPQGSVLQFKYIG